MCVQLLSLVPVFVIPWTVARQAPLSMEFSRQEYWSGLSFPTPGDLPNPETEPASLVSPALEKEIATHSSILAWKIPWTEELGRRWSLGVTIVGDDLVTKLLK